MASAELLEIIARSKSIDQLPENFTLNPEDYLITHSLQRNEPLKIKTSKILKKSLEDAKEYTDEAKKALEDGITALQEDIYLRIGDEVLELLDDLDVLEDFILHSFKDGIVNDLESSNIGRYIQSLENEKSDIDGRFSSLYASEYLNEDEKEDLQQAKLSFDQKHNDLIALIESIIAKEEVTSEDEVALNQMFQEYRDEIKAFTQAYELAYNRIAEARIDAIKLGTRNILLDSKTAQFQIDGNILRYQFSTIEIRWDNSEIRWDNTEIRWDSGKPNVSSELLEGDHIVSVDVVSDVSQAITLKLTDGMGASSERVWELEAGRKTRVYVHLKAHWNNQTLDFSIEKHVPDSDLEVSRLKLAEGNKSDNYSQAPEDVEKAIEKARQEVIEANEEYAKAEAERAELEAKVWADGKLTALEKMLLADATAKANAARRYAEAQDTHLQVLTEAYADGKIDTLESELIDLSEANLTAAQGYVDSQIQLEQIRSDAYADEEISDLDEKLLGIAEDNLAAAKDYAEAQDTALQTAIQAYADGIVSDAEARAIAEAQAEAQAAKDYAQAQDALLDTAIRAYADGEITDAEARAIHEAELKVQAVRGEMETLRTDLEDEIDQVNSRIDALETDTLAAIEDGILTQTEISNLKSQKNLLDKEKTDVDRRYQITSSNPHLEGTAKDDLADAEGIYQTAYTALSDYYEDIFATEEIPAGDPVALLDAYRNALAEFSSAMDEALSAIAQKKADLAEGSAILHTNTRLNDEVIPAINDVQAAADALEFITDEAFWDGKLDENEAKALQLYIEPLQTEKEDIYSKYAVVYTNDLLKDPARENLYQAYDAYDDVHTDLIAAIQALAVGEITPAKRQAVSDAFETHRTALQSLTTAFEEAAKAIEYEHIDQIIVGTRNLILGEVEFSGNDNRTVELSGESIRWDNTEVSWDNTEVRWDSGHPNLSTDNLVGQHAIGLDIIVPTQRTIRIEIRDTVAPFTVKAREHLVPAGRKTRIGAIGEGKEGNTGFVVTVLNAQGAEISNVKLEIGNKWTDWNESPEDVGDKINQARLNAQSAAEAYAKAEAEKQALLVKVHADGKITQMEKRLLDHADAVANAARRYSEAEDAHLQILLESYADGEIDDMEAALIQLSNDNLAAANQAAQAAANAAQTAAEAYADGKITDSEAAMIAYADNAASAAQQAAIAADEALQGALEAYADGKVSDEEQARINALQAYADAAEDYADAAASAAQTAAQAHADGEITEAEARAIADATAKMNEAKQLAQDLFNDLQDDVDAISANAQQAINVANELSENLGAFGTKIGEHSIITGAVEVGDGEGVANAGVSGVTNKGRESVRFYSGTGHNNRETAPWNVDDRGIHKWHDDDGTLTFTIAKDQNGKQELKCYNNDGTVLWRLGRFGLRFENEVPESWTYKPLIFLSSAVSPLDSALENAYRASLTESSGDTSWYLNSTPDTPRYEYNAGNSFTSDNYVHLEPYYFKSDDKGSDYINDGWYANPGQYHYIEVGNNTVEFECYRVKDGKYVAGSQKTLDFNYYKAPPI